MPASAAPLDVAIHCIMIDLVYPAVARRQSWIFSDTMVQSPALAPPDDTHMMHER